MVRKHTRKHRGGGLGASSATWPPDNSAFGRFVGSPLNADNLEFEASGMKGGKRHKKQKAGAGPADAELFAAIQSQDAGRVKAALTQGANVNAVEPESGNTPLIEAVHKDNPELVQILIDAGAQVDAKGSENGTALYWAADNMPLTDVKTPTAVKINTIIKILLEHGAKPQMVYDTLAKYPEALDHSKQVIERVRNQKMAVEVGVKKDLPTPLPSFIRGFLGGKRRKTKKAGRRSLKRK